MTVVLNYQKNIEMKMISVNKAQLAGLNNKRYYFSDGLVSFL